MHYVVAVHCAAGAGYCVAADAVLLVEDYCVVVAVVLFAKDYCVAVVAVVLFAKDYYFADVVRVVPGYFAPVDEPAQLRLCRVALQLNDP